MAAVEAEEEFDFFTADDLADGFRGALAAWALEYSLGPKETSFRRKINSRRYRFGLQSSS